MSIDYIAAHKFSSNHRDKLLCDSLCGCFDCTRVFSPKKIQQWIEDPGGTAVCPYCGTDSVIGESSGYPITDTFLKSMHDYWCETHE